MPIAIRAADALRRVLLTLAVLVLGCGGEGEPALARKHSSLCVAPAGVSNRPATIEQTVALVNALPKPLTLPCFLESLARPLPMFASRSQVSAQPASGPRTPRLFLFVGDNVMTVVPAGEGSQLLELGEQREGFRSLKAEIEFPVTVPLRPDDPLSSILFDDVFTGCAFCHASEAEETTALGGRAFVSQALRPFDSEGVRLDAVRAEAMNCDSALEPQRCAMLDALFGWGETEEQRFPAAMPTFGN